MKITKIESIPYAIPVKKFSDAYTSFTHSNAVLIKINTDEGLIGLGEACAWEPEFYGETVETIHSLILNYIAPKIIGEDPTNINQIMQTLDKTLARLTCVKEGIDLALFDLLGKILNVPVYTLLGGKFRDRIPIASEIGIDTPRAMAKNAEKVLEMGINVIKIKGSSDKNKDVERIKAVRSAVGAKIPLRLDPNASWDTASSIKVMQLVENCDLQLLEQPIPSWDYKGMAHIRKNISVPLMADESIWTTQDAIKLHDYEACDYLNLKIAKTCGLSKGKKVEIVAEAIGLPCIVGTELEPGISSIAKIHFAASMAIHPLASEFTEITQLNGSILENPLEINDGCLNVPIGPGFGVNINEKALEKFKL
jgi:muconate cycloisomerase|tara:strand:- start:561 stop:1658 length:1098 start_codon:yes stop_codon:yes gene_type:complete